MGTTAGWRTDPTGIFDQRWWDGARWTEEVRVGDREARSELDASPLEALDMADELRSGSARVATAERTTAPDPATAPASPSPGAEPWAVTLTPQPQAPPPPSGPPGAPPTTATPPRPEPPPPPVAATVDGWLWMLVALPVLAGFATMATPGAGWLVLAVGMAWNVVGVLLDRRANPALAARTSAAEMVAWALVLMPVYVFRRQRSLGRGLAPFWVYVTIMASGIVASLLGAVLLAVAPPATIDADLLERQIERAVWDEIAIATTIECPDHQPAEPGHRFSCTLADGVGVATIRAVVTSTAGDVTWTIE